VPALPVSALAKRDIPQLGSRRNSAGIQSSARVWNRYFAEFCNRSICLALKNQSRTLSSHRSDRGNHYTSARYQSLLGAHGMRCSVSRIANCHDDAVAESFFSTLKNEQTLHDRYHTRAHARATIFEFIELLYNPCVSTRIYTDSVRCSSSVSARG